MINRQDIIDRLLKKGKYAYGTPEYWVKERKAKFIRNARQKEELEKKLYSSIINFWSLTTITEMPLYKLLSNDKTRN